MMRLWFAIAWLFCAGSLYASADLELQSLRVQIDSQAHVMQIRVYLANHGPDNAPQPGCNVYLYSNQKLVLSQNFLLQSIAAQETRTDSIKLDLPAGTISSVKAEIYDSQQPDVQPSNNVAQANLSALGVTTADVQILEASIKTNQPVEERVAIVKVRVHNNGPDLAINSNLKVSLVLFGNAVVWQEKRIQKIEPGSDSDMEMPVVMNKPISSSNGTFLIQITPDDTKTKDPDETNNSYTLPVQLVLRMPDLVIKDVGINAKGVLVFSVSNAGNAPADPSVTALFINGALIERYKTPQIRPKEKQTFRYDEDVIAPGTQVSIVADYNADVAESSEENNRTNFTPEP
jgi:subtilase family serine protease